MLYESLFSDLDNENETFLGTIFNDVNGKSKIRELLYSNKILSLTENILLSFFWNKYALVSYLNSASKKYDEIYLIFISSSLQKFYTEAFLKKLKNTYKNVSLFLYYVDPVFALQARNAFQISQKTELFSKVFTFDKEDSEKYGYIYYNTPYSKCHNPPPTIDYDLYFCGSVKGRAGVLKDIYEHVGDVVDCKWDIYSNKATSNTEKEIISTFSSCKTGDMLMPYNVVLDKTLRANCILDLVQKGQSGCTIRFYEAICNNKKLLTNNPYVLTSKYYKSGFIQYFNKANEIDKEWIIKREEVSYNYNNEFSPKNLLSHL